jgi:hypothetical protein
VRWIIGFGRFCRGLGDDHVPQLLEKHCGRL